MMHIVAQESGESVVESEAGSDDEEELDSDEEEGLDWDELEARAARRVPLACLLACFASVLTAQAGQPCASPPLCSLPLRYGWASDMAGGGKFGTLLLGLTHCFVATQGRSQAGR